MNLLQPGENELEYGSITVRQREEERRQKTFQQCSKKTSILMSLLACCILAVGMFVWFQLIAKNHYGKMSDPLNEDGDGIDNIPFGRGGNLGHTLMINDAFIDYRTISNNDWRELWINIGYSPEIINNIDFHTYSILGVDYQKMYRDINRMNGQKFNAKTDNDQYESLLLPSVDNCGCNYCLGFCESIYCAVCPR